MGYELHLISWALCQGENKSAISVCVCVRERRCILWFWLVGLFAYSVWFDTSRIYVYSICPCNGIFHSVMLINLIFKSRNMKQESKSRLPLRPNVCQYTLSQFPQLFSWSSGKTFKLVVIVRTRLPKVLRESTGVTMALAPLLVM